MSTVTDNIEILGGTQMQADKLAIAAGQVSDWLTAGMPNTKPKTVETLLAEAAGSLYATYDGHAVGHVALKLFPEPAEVQVGSNRGSPAYWNMPHYGVESLVVKPGMTGLGIGKVLVSNVCLLIEQEVSAQSADVTTADHPIALASALASGESKGLFLDHGFHFNPEMEFVAPYEGINLNPALGKAFVSKLFSQHG